MKRLTPKQLKKSEMSTFQHVTKVTNKLLTSATMSFSRQFQHITHEDLKQECLIKLIEIIKTHQDTPIEELVQIYKTAIFNLMKDTYRKEKYRRTVKVTTREEEETEFTEFDLIDESFESNPENVVMFEQYCISIEEELDDNTKRQFFRLLLYPDKELINISARQLASNQDRKKKTKKLVMNINKLKITYSHIAERLNISPSTASRHIQEIKMLTEKILKNETLK